MLTPNDRLAQIEFNLNVFKTETVKAYGEMASELVLAKTFSETLIKQVGSFKAQMDQQFDRVNMRLDSQDTHLMYLHERTDKIEKEIIGVKQDVAGLKQDMVEVKSTLTQILERLPEKS